MTDMELLNTLQPERVFYYFQEISRIPRGSGHTQKISAYLMEFARNHGLEAAQDSAGNVVILKEGTEGYEHSPVVILQGHSDMVCEKKPGSSHDFQTEGLDLILEGISCPPGIPLWEEMTESRWPTCWRFWKAGIFPIRRWRR